ncbi:MAG: aminomethyl-transferring glycine dehydrogenase subunit GcvPA [Deferrisomatales bacterium]
MRYFPHTDADVAAMLGAVGAGSVDELFAAVPERFRLRAPLGLPEPLTEWELLREAGARDAAVAPGAPGRVFLGAGSYEHHIPASVASLAGRSEFVTGYTPYQPEASQGTLQAIFEYQTLVCRLLGMEVANASVYDGASALVEALLLALRVTRRGRVALSRAVHPLYRQAVATYLEAGGYEVVELPVDALGTTDLSALAAAEGLAAVAVQSPNFFGCVEDLGAAAAAARAAGALSVACFSEALAWGLLRSPGACGADLACGEGQSLGIPQSFGGPGLGVFTARREHLRQLPGRLVGQTVDREGRRGFVLTLATREQHIRRERATSNLCTNQGLCALTAAIYLASLGGPGLRELARLNRDKAEYLKARLGERGLRARFGATTFNEFAVEWPGGARGRYEELLDEGWVAGLPLGRFYPELEGSYLLCATETASRQDLDALVERMTA